MATKKASPKKAVKAPAKAPVKAAAKAPVKPKAKEATKSVPKVAAKPTTKVAPAKKAVAAKPTPAPVKKAPAKAAPSKPTPAPKAAAQKAVAPKAAAKPTPAPVVAEARKEEVKKPAVIQKKAPAFVAGPPRVKKVDSRTAPTKPVVLPKIKAKTSRTYNPDFTQSVLDQAKPEPTGPLMKYSDAELMEFRELIQRKLDSAKKELNYLQGLITRKDDMGGDDNDSRYMTMEDGSLSMEREQLSQMASRQITFIDHLEKALVRIENKTYGICRVTGKLIDKARLRAVPHATLSIEAKMKKN